VLELVHHAGRARLLLGDTPRFGFVNQGVQQADGGRHEDLVASRFHEIQTFFVRIFAVIENIHAVPDSHLDGSRGADMCGHPFAVRVRGFHGDCEFVLAHDGHVRPGVGNGLVARHVELDRVNTFADQHPHGPQHLVGAADHHGDRFAVQVQAAFVAEIAGVGQLRTGGEEPRSRGVPRIDEIAHGDVEPGFRGSPAHAGSEPCFEHDARMVQREQRVIFRRDIAGVGDARLVRKGQVRVAFDQPGNDGVPGHIDPVEGLAFHRAGRIDALDAIATHQYVGRKRGTATAIPDRTAC